MAAGHSTVPPPYALPQHVYVDVTGRWGATQEPGLLLEWRRNRAGRWEALVACASGGGMTPASCRGLWVDAAHVRKA